MSDKYLIVEDAWLTTTPAISSSGHKVYRIKALKDFADVKAGDYGGFVEGYHNLSQEGTCWIYDNSCVVDDSRVERSAKVMEGSIVREASIVTDDAVLIHSTARWSSRIRGTSHVTHSFVIKHSTVAGASRLCNARVHSCTRIYDSTVKETTVQQGARLVRANIELARDYFVINNVDADCSTLTVYRSNIQGEICVYDHDADTRYTFDEYSREMDRVHMNHPDLCDYEESVLILQLIKLRFKI